MKLPTRTMFVMLMTCAVATSAVAEGARQGQAQSAARPGTAIVVHGCVQPADSSGTLGGDPLGAAATPNNAGDVANRAEPAAGFVLADARPAPPDRSAGAGAGGHGAAGTSGRTDPAPRAYALVGSEEELATYRGQRVEVAGTLAPPARDRATAARQGADPQVGDDGSRGGAGASGASADPGDSAFRTGVPQLRVQSIRRVDGTCSAR